MENKDLQILAEISDLAASLRRQLEELEEKIAHLKSVYHESADYQYDEVDIPIDIDIDEMSAEEPAAISDETETEAVAEVVESVADDVVDALEDIIEDPVSEEPISSESILEESVFEQVAETMAEVPPVRQAVIDVLEDKRAWKTDMPGAPVRDIRSAISLNDRVLFINRLFNEDPMSFQDMLSKINNMTSIEEVIEAVVAEHPDWDLGSEIVYRFMMAVRRKIR